MYKSKGLEWIESTCQGSKYLWKEADNGWLPRREKKTQIVRNGSAKNEL